MRESSEKIIKMIVDEANSHYEEGNQSKCYAAVWRRVIRPKYGIQYNTLLSYIRLIKYGSRPSNRTNPNQLLLFDDEPIHEDTSR